MVPESKYLDFSGVVEKYSKENVIYYLWYHAGRLSIPKHERMNRTHPSFSMIAEMWPYDDIFTTFCKRPMYISTNDWSKIDPTLYDQYSGPGMANKCLQSLKN
jgi:hypothetical protein